MSLSPGSKLGHYDVLSALGAGGMGEVYRARDTKLGRDVAIKVLPAVFASDEDRLARFTREAQTLASLNHPNIAHIHGLEESGSVRALVMELVEGKDLSEMIARGPMPLADVLPIARQIADALEAAHEQGIIHRDLKPANVKVRADGTVKVLDFGLAKAMDPSVTSGADLTQSPTLTARATQMGVIIGTAAYMSPEQARGKTVDRRADIWAFGVVLYEMLAGRRAFDGEDVSTTLANVIKDDVDWTALPADLPAPVRRLLRRCLEKDPRRRLAAIGDARLELDETEPALAAPAASAARRGIRLPVVAVIAAVAVLASAGVTRLLVRNNPTAPTNGVTRLTIQLPEGDLLAGTSMVPLALSPDGSHLVYVALHDGRTRLLLRRFSDDEPVALTGTEGAMMPFFSPDGEWIAFFAQGKLRKIAVGGSEIQTLCDVPTEARGGCWGADGTVYFAPNNTSGLWTVSENGGTPAELTRLDQSAGEVSHRWPQVIDDAGVLLYAVWTGPGTEECRVVAHSLETGERHVLVPVADMPRYVRAGFLLYSRRDDLFAAPWRPSQTDLGGVARVTLPEHPRMVNEGAGCYAVADNGTMVYLAGGAARYERQLVWVDRDGREQVLPAPARDYQSAVISPDGSRAVVQVMEATTGLWLYDFSRDTMTPLATTGGSSQSPVWTPDGTTVIYRGTRTGTRNIYRRAADGTGVEERLTRKEGTTQSPTSVSPDGEWLLYNDAGERTQGSGGVWMLSLRGAGDPRPLVQTPPAFANGQVSRDGKWMAYLSGASGTMEVYIQPFPGPGASRQVSNGGGSEPLWSRSGRELFYLNGLKLMAVDISPGPAPVIGQPRVLFEGRYREQINGNTAYDVSPDGRFLRIRQVTPEPAEDHLEVVLNWTDQLVRLAAEK